MTSEQRERYAHEIIKVLEARKAGYMMSCAEWHILAGWMDREIPLAIVLLGISQCNPPKSLLYVRPAVEEAIDHWERALA